MSDIGTPTWMVIVLIGFLFSIVVRESVKREFKEELEFQRAKKDTVFIYIVNQKSLPDSLFLKPDPEDSCASTRKRN